MKFFLIITFISSISFRAYSQEKWELPIKNDVVYFEFKSIEFKNIKKALKNYYCDPYKSDKFIKSPHPQYE